MSTKTKIKWRLGNLPTPTEVTELVKDGILTKDEAREILFSQEAVEERDKKSLEDEVKFLRELVSKLSNNSRTEIIKQIEYVEMPYKKYGWYKPYEVYCSTNNAIYTTTSGQGSLQMLANNDLNSQSLNVSYSATPDFTAIKTF